MMRREDLITSNTSQTGRRRVVSSPFSKWKPVFSQLQIQLNSQTHSISSFPPQKHSLWIWTRIHKSYFAEGIRNTGVKDNLFNERANSFGIKLFHLHSGSVVCKMRSVYPRSGGGARPSTGVLEGTLEPSKNTWLSFTESVHTQEYKQATGCTFISFINIYLTKAYGQNSIFLGT